MVNTLDICPWCHEHLTFHSCDWIEAEADKKTFKCRNCGCTFQVSKTILTTGEESLLANPNTKLRHLIKSMTC